MTDISKEYVGKVLYAAPFADNDAGIPQMCDLIRAQAARIEELQSSQLYTYIGKDGKSVLARDLEDERDALKARIEELEAQCASVKPSVWLGPEDIEEIMDNTMDVDVGTKELAEAVFEEYQATHTQSADDVHNAAIEAAAGAVKEAFHMKGIIQKSQSAILALKRNKGEG